MLVEPAPDAAHDAGGFVGCVGVEGFGVGVGVAAGGAVVLVGLAVGVAVAAPVADAVAVTVGVGVTLGEAVVGVADGVWLALAAVDLDGDAVGSSSEQALRARAASSMGAATRVRRADRSDPRDVMRPTVTGVTDVTVEPRDAGRGHGFARWTGPSARQSRSGRPHKAGSEHDLTQRHTCSASFAAQCAHRR